MDMNKKISEFILYFLYFNLLVIYLFFIQHTSFGDNWDDFIVWSMLKDNTPTVLILSYPLSFGMSKLYSALPNYQWFSLLYLLYLLFMIFVISKTVQHTKTLKLKILFLLFYSIILFHFSSNISITYLTGLLIVVIVPTLFYSYTILLSGLFLALFLRTELMLIYAPIIILMIGIFYHHLKRVSNKNIAALFIYISIICIAFIYIKPPIQYTQWKVFNNARGYFLDSKNSLLTALNAQINSDITDEERFLLIRWWIQDEEILPSEKVINASGNLLDRISLSTFHLSEFMTNDLNYLFSYCILLAFYILYLLFLKKDFFTIINFILITTIVFFVYSYRDVHRVLIPLILIYFLIIFYLSLFKTKDKNYMIYLFGFVFILSIFSLENYYTLQKRYNYTDMLKSQLSQLIKKYPHFKYEISLQIPYLKAHHYLDNILKNQHLFQEYNWFDFHKNSICLPYGWLARQPFFYKERNISSQKDIRKYTNYHQFLINPSTAFIGEPMRTDKHNEKKFLSIYDDFYNKNNNCKHQIELVDSNQYFSISQITNRCKQHKIGDNNDTFQQSTTNWR
jgi:hypothetical protein